MSDGFNTVIFLAMAAAERVVGAEDARKLKKQGGYMQKGEHGQSLF